MMRFILIVFLMTVVTDIGQAQDQRISSRILYWYYQNVSTNVPPADEIFKLKKKGQNTEYTWFIQNPPSEQTLLALDEATVIDWVKGKDSEAEDASIDAQALMKVVSELTNTPIGQVKSKFKKAKKEKKK